ncbi:unnamed protein product [Ranitomeya imitator]|uniref:ribonuclease H n=1 Tax=Ranitomeya imitator TaxID=111125 RepID=A0ABN9MLG2_9NEOB|nr:unnamed protein product [Ranitomeya imitator]
MAFVDSGAALNLMDLEFARRCGFFLEPLQYPILLRGIDATPLAKNKPQYWTQLTMCMAPAHQEDIRFLVLHNLHDVVVLGLPWLQVHNPVLDWKSMSVSSWGYQGVHGDVPFLSISSSTTPSEVPEFLSDYRDVFDEPKSSALPPHRDCDCAIDLIPGSKFPKVRLFNLSVPEHAAAMRSYGDEWKTAFNTPEGHFEYLVMPFGLSNAPSVFQSFMHDIFREYLDKFRIVYLDDILVFSDDWESHVKPVRIVFQVLRANSLFVKGSKCLFGVQKVSFLGFIFSPSTIEMDPVKVQAIYDWTQPTSLKSLQKFLGFANFYRCFINNFSSIAKPLTDLTKKGQVESSDCPGVDTVVDRLQQIWTHVVDNLTLSQEKAQRFANRRRCVGPRLRVGDLVWLSSRHIPMKVSSPKFKPRFIGPYRISEVLNPVSFRLTLPASFSIHNVFHRSLLRRYVAPVVPSVDPPAPVLFEGELEYVVEKILDSRISGRKLQYLVKWKGYGQEDNSWVFASDVHAADLVRAFHLAHPGRPGGSVHNSDYTQPSLILSQRGLGDNEEEEEEEKEELLSCAVDDTTSTTVIPSVQHGWPEDREEEESMRCALLSSCSGCERRSAGKQSADVTALLSGCPALTARPEKQSAEDRQRKDGNQGKHRVTKRGPALSYPMFTLVTGDLGIVGRWRAVCVTALQRPNSDAAAIRIVVGIAAASLCVTFRQCNSPLAVLHPKHCNAPLPGVQPQHCNATMKVLQAQRCNAPMPVLHPQHCNAPLLGVQSSTLKFSTAGSSASTLQFSISRFFGLNAEIIRCRFSSLNTDILHCRVFILNTVILHCRFFSLNTAILHCQVFSLNSAMLQCRFFELNTAMLHCQVFSLNTAMLYCQVFILNTRHYPMLTLFDKPQQAICTTCHDHISRGNKTTSMITTSMIRHVAAKHPTLWAEPQGPGRVSAEDQITKSTSAERPSYQQLSNKVNSCTAGTMQPASISEMTTSVTSCSTALAKRQQAVLKLICLGDKLHNA